MRLLAKTAAVAFWLALCALPAALAAAKKGQFTCPMLIGGEQLETTAVHSQLAQHPKDTVWTVRAKGPLPCQGFLEDRPYYLRAKTSDAAVLRMVLDKHEFQHLDELFGDATPRRVLDLGANAGLASSYFAARWPDAQIAAVEPSKANFAMAVMNTMDARNVRMFLGGIWDKPAKLSVRVNDRYVEGKAMAEWGFVVEELSTQRLAQLTVDDIVPAYTVPDIMATMGWEYVDYMKVDVECSEFQVFSNISSEPRPWLQQVGCLSMELHNWCPGRDPALVQDGLRGAGFEFHGQFGELQFWCRPAAEREAAAAAAVASALAGAGGVGAGTSSSSGGQSSSSGGGIALAGGGRSSLLWLLTLAVTLVLLLGLLRILAPVAARLLGLATMRAGAGGGNPLLLSKNGARVQVLPMLHQQQQQQQQRFETIKAAL